MIRWVLLMAAVFMTLNHAAAEEEVELAEIMGNLQRYSHKLGLAVQAKNLPLVKFYLHEVEELEHELRGIDSYEDLPIGDSTKKVFSPALELLEGSFASPEDWTRISERYKNLLSSCNACHAVTKHEFIVITEPKQGNSYNQAFESVK